MTKIESGRSMVEMLGVLAIIGVLSIGGIAGYTMAMNRHKANTVVDFATKMAVAGQTYGEGGVTNAVTAATLGVPAPDGIADSSTVEGDRDNGIYTVTVSGSTLQNGVNDAIASITGGKANSGVIKFNESGITS